LFPRQRQCLTFALRQAPHGEVRFCASRPQRAAPARQPCAFGCPAQGLPLHDRVQTQHVVNTCSVREGLFFSTRRGHLRAARFEHTCEDPRGGSPPTANPIVLVVIVTARGGARLHGSLGGARDSFHRARGRTQLRHASRRRRRSKEWSCEPRRSGRSIFTKAGRTKGRDSHSMRCPRCHPSLRAALRCALHASFVKRSRPAAPSPSTARATRSSPRPDAQGAGGQTPHGSAWPSKVAIATRRVRRVPQTPDGAPTTRRKDRARASPALRGSVPARAPPGHAAAPARRIAVERQPPSEVLRRYSARSGGVSPSRRRSTGAA
jgi:hypothetical protein